MSAVHLVLPFPPSVNNLFINLKSGGRAPSARYKAWVTEAGWEAKRQRPGKVVGPYTLCIRAGRPDARKRDIDNLAKPVNDLLKTLGVIEDDSLCQRLEMSWAGPGKTISVNVLSTREVMP